MLWHHAALTHAQAHTPVNTTRLPLKILVLDASPQQLLATAVGLVDETVEILHASEVVQAQALARQHVVALVLVDLDLDLQPDPDRRAADAGLQQLLGGERLRGVPVVLLGSSAAQADALHEVASAALDFMLKPAPAHRLQRRLRFWLALAAQQVECEERQQELQRLARLQAQMVEALSHDIRTPLSALMLNAELIARGSEAQNLRQAAQRIKSALTMLGLQIDHLVNVAGSAEAELRPMMRPLDMRALVLDRLAAFRARSPGGPQWLPGGEGDATASVDATLFGDAIDGLLKLAAAHAGQGPVNVAVDGRSRRSITLRLQFDAVLPEAEQRQLFGGVPAHPGQDAPRVGPALAEPESIVRAHGGSLIGRSSAREGTLFEWMLPRAIE